MYQYIIDYKLLLLILTCHQPTNKILGYGLLKNILVDVTVNL